MATHGEHSILVSSGHNRPNASGLYCFDGLTVRRIDAYPSAGLSVRGGLFYRSAPLRQGDGAELLVYDELGVLRYARIDGVGDVHDILACEDGNLLCVSSRDNAIVTIATDGTTTPRWKADAPFDAWHVNCLAESGGRLYATAFGRSTAFRGWHPTRGAGTGILFDVHSGATIVDGLTQPHSPKRVDDAWLICDSGVQTVVRVEDGGSRFAVDVGGFSRGLCVAGEHVYVAVSTPREGAEPAAKGWLSVLSRERWSEIDRIPMPCSGMYDVVAVDPSALAGIEAGFRFGSERERYFGQLAMFEQVGVTPQRVWAVAEPLPPEMCRVEIAADVPPEMALGEVIQVACTVFNAGDGFLVSSPPYPTELCYRWFDAAGEAVGAGTWLHTRLPRVLTPRDRVTFNALIASPPAQGPHTLRITLLQEGIRWFDDLDVNNAASAHVDVGAPLP